MEVNPHHFSLDEVDDDTASLIIQLQREDVEELQSSDKGKNRESDVSDADLAMATFQEELQHSSIVFNDRCMSRSLARAVITDSALLTDLVAQEDATANDRIVAERLDSGEEIGSGTAENVGDPNLDDLLIARLMALYVSGTEGDCFTPAANEDEQTNRGESSRWAMSRENTSDTARHECASCGDHRRAFETFRAPCRHYYCQECLTQLFELSTTDETLFPPRCCRQEIHLSSVRLYLDRELVQRFQRKVIEFQTSDRTYCSQPTCSAFINPDNITDDRATCTSCFTTTCTICKGTSHDGDCPADTATQQMLEAAREQGWQRCYNCRRVVELDVGCNHMTYAFCIPLLYLTKLTRVPAVLVARNSAMFAESAGRPVPATSGMKLVFWLEHNRSWRASGLEILRLPRNSWSRCNRRWRTSETAIIAHMRAGGGLTDLTSAKSVITNFHSTFSSAGSVGSGLATGARRTGCEKTAKTLKQCDRHGD